MCAENGFLLRPKITKTTLSQTAKSRNVSHKRTNIPAHDFFCEAQKREFVLHQNRKRVPHKNTFHVQRTKRGRHKINPQCDRLIRAAGSQIITCSRTPVCGSTLKMPLSAIQMQVKECNSKAISSTSARSLENAKARNAHQKNVCAF